LYSSITAPNPASTHLAHARAAPPMRARMRSRWRRALWLPDGSGRRARLLDRPSVRVVTHNAEHVHSAGITGRLGIHHPDEQVVVAVPSRLPLGPLGSEVPSVAAPGQLGVLVPALNETVAQLLFVRRIERQKVCASQGIVDVARYLREAGFDSGGKLLLDSLALLAWHCRPELAQFSTQGWQLGKRLLPLGPQARVGRQHVLGESVCEGLLA